jgi:hypothetical protein
MCTKAYFDIATLPWILENSLANLQARENIMVMNDFIDGATTWSAYKLSEARFDGQKKIKETAPVDVAKATATAAPIIKAAPETEPAEVIESCEAALQAKVDAETELKELQTRHAILNAQVTTKKFLQGEGKEVDEVALRVHEVARMEVAANILAQGDAIKIAEKRFQQAEAPQI